MTYACPFLIAWRVVACNASGCGPDANAGNYVQPMVSPQAETVVSFSTIASAFKAPSCVNCHAVVATGFQNRSASGYETGNNFGLPPNHPQVDSGSSCTGCHTNALLPQGNHPIPWQAPPAGMDLRGKSDFQLCQMAQNPGSIADSVPDHLLGDPLILWAVQGGPLPSGAGNTDDAFAGNWEEAVNAWVEGGMSCN